MDMANRDNLSIVDLSNYEYILYRSSIGKLFLLLTRESGFGVYDHLIEAPLTNTGDMDLTQKEIYSLLKDYRLNPGKFVEEHKTIMLDSSVLKAALNEWREKDLSRPD